MPDRSPPDELPVEFAFFRRLIGKAPAGIVAGMPSLAFYVSWKYLWKGNLLVATSIGAPLLAVAALFGRRSLYAGRIVGAAAAGLLLAIALALVFGPTRN